MVDYISDGIQTFLDCEMELMVNSSKEISNLERIFFSFSFLGATRFGLIGTSGEGEKEKTWAAYLRSGAPSNPIEKEWRRGHQASVFSAFSTLFLACRNAIDAIREESNPPESKTP